MKLEIVVDGDSWSFGCEIVGKDLAAKYGESVYAGHYDFFPENDSYRIPRIWSTYLGKILDANVTNISWPADDNGTILNRTISHITKNYLIPNKPLDNLLVIVGWSSPERNFFWYKDSNLSHRFRLWPQVRHFDAPAQEEFWNLYVNYLWNVEEYMPRYVMNVLTLQNFCNANNIKWLCYNSFYQTPGADVKQWKDLNVINELRGLNLGGYTVFNDDDCVRHHDNYDYLNIWKTIDPVRFYKKYENNNTFFSHIMKNGSEPILNGWHPSPQSHELWANELANYLNSNKLI
jgi:hypothetical protein